MMARIVRVFWATAKRPGLPALVACCTGFAVSGCQRLEKAYDEILEGDDDQGDDDSPPPLGAADGVFEVHATDSLGTGFLVAYEDELYGVTAFHVVHSDEEVLAVKRHGAGARHYRQPLYAEVSYVDPDKDIAILRFDPGLEVEQAKSILGAPLLLASETELGDVREVESWGITIQRDAITLLHSQSRKVTSALRPVTVLDVFTGGEISRNQPQGFSLSEAIPRGFSGGPAMFMAPDGPRVAGLLSNIEITSIYDESNAVIVASNEILRALAEARKPPRVADLTSAILLDEDSFDVKMSCQKNLQEIMRHLRSIRVAGEDEAMQQLAQGKDIVAEPHRVRELARFVAPSTRSSFFAADAQFMVGQQIDNLRIEFIDAQLEEAEHLWNNQDRKPYCSPMDTGDCRNCSDDYMCKSTKILQALFMVNKQADVAIGGMRAKVDQLILFEFLKGLRMALPEESYAAESSYEPLLGEPASISSTMVVSKQRKHLEYMLRDNSRNSKQIKDKIRFEYTQGTCLLALDEPSP